VFKTLDTYQWILLTSAHMRRHRRRYWSESRSEFSEALGDELLIAACIALFVAGVFTGAAFYIKFRRATGPPCS